VSTASVDELARWVGTHLPRGRVLHIGDAPSPLPHGRDHQIVTINHLASVLRHRDLFDNAVVTAVSPSYGEPGDLIDRIAAALKPGATLVLTVPFGLQKEPDGPMFYPSSLRRLVEPVFEVTRLELIGDNIALVGQRRDSATARAEFAPDATERAFATLERGLKAKVKDLRS
jgi:hypothetical protein